MTFHIPRTLKNMKSIWPNQAQAAVSLTYDDALPVHIEQVSQQHESNGSLATFYTDIHTPFMQHHAGWKEVAQRGHELGNHSIFHPCRKDESMQWLEDCFDLKEYTPERFRRELQVANFVLNLTDGKDRRSYGNNCCNTTIGSGENETSMKPVLKDLFGAARGPLNNKIISPQGKYDLHELGHFNGDGKRFEEIKGLIESTIQEKGWIVFMFHGVGKGTHSLYMEQEEHDQLVRWLGKNRDLIWSRPVIEVADRLRGQQR